VVRRIADITDGTSNTIMASEYIPATDTPGLAHVLLSGKVKDDRVAGFRSSFQFSWHGWSPFRFY
jgi:hypothetical protein